MLFHGLLLVVQSSAETTVDELVKISSNVTTRCFKSENCYGEGWCCVYDSSEEVECCTSVYDECEDWKTSEESVNGYNTTYWFNCPYHQTQAEEMLGAFIGGCIFISCMCFCCWHAKKHTHSQNQMVRYSFVGPN